jgi:hypothetical protein
MALQGINMPLMPLGMEALQAATFAGLGLDPEQLQDFFPGPAFLAWGRMGNIQVRRVTACLRLPVQAAGWRLDLY